MTRHRNLIFKFQRPVVKEVCKIIKSRTHKPLPYERIPLGSYHYVQWDALIKKRSYEKKPVIDPIKDNIPEVQTDDEGSQERLIGWFIGRFFKHTPIGKQIGNMSRKFIEKLIEDFAVLTCLIMQASTPAEYATAVLAFAKFRSSEALVHSKLAKQMFHYFSEHLMEPLKRWKTEPQAQTGNPFTNVRQLFLKFDEIKATPIFEKLYSFIMYAMSLSLSVEMNLSFERFGFTKLEAEAKRRQYHMGGNFVYCMLDTLTFLCERGYQSYLTGNLDPIYHSGSAYSDWFDQASELKRNSLFLTNPEIHGFDRFTFLSDLNDAIEKGEAIASHSSKLGLYEAKLAKSVLNDLILIKKHELCRKAASADRKAPFSVLLYGASGVGKSTLTNMLFQYYGKLFGLKTTPEMKYTRNPADRFWTLFTTSQWCIQLDDIAFLDPSKASEADPTLIEMLQIINMVPFVPSMADLADKGRTPVQSRFVIATTNTEDLNAYAYFSCPLAVQRRLPWIIEVEPKPEYKTDEFLDGSKVPIIEDGTFPDYWIYHVKKVLPGPVVDAKKQKAIANITPYNTYNNVVDFLKWFAEAARDFDAKQAKAIACSTVMRDVTLCNCCDLPSGMCQQNPVDDGDETEDELEVQTKDMVIYEPPVRPMVLRDQYEAHASFQARLIKNIENTHWRTRLRYYFYYKLYVWYTTGIVLRWILNFLFGEDQMAFWAISVIKDEMSSMESWRLAFRSLGDATQKKIGVTVAILSLITAIAGCYTLYKSSEWLVKIMGEDLLESQTIDQIGHRPESSTEERYNPWYRDDYQLSDIDVSPMTKSWKGMSIEQIDKLIQPNLVFFKVNRSEGVIRRVRSICVGGHLYVTNNHGLPEGTFEMEYIQAPHKDGVNPNVTITVTPNMIKRYPDLDTCFIQIPMVPPKKDIRELFASDNMSGRFKGYYVGRAMDGSIERRTVDNIQLIKQHENFQLRSKCDTWTGFVKTPTIIGDCGLTLLTKTHYGPVILGFHYLGLNNSVFAVKLKRSLIDSAADHFGRPLFQPNPPALKSETAEKILGDLNKKSTFRFIDEGTANVYGTLEGFRRKPKSEVVESLIAPELVEFGITPKYTKPDMKSYKPWRLAALGVVQQKHLINSDILGECTQAYIKEVLSSLDKDQLKEVFVYDAFTAVNGAAGVTYVDKLNRNTSAGEPWNKSKKYFLHSIPEECDLQDPVEVSDEIKQRVVEILEKYGRAERASPVFCMSLKDEAVSFKKAEIGKTRAFAGAPMDWVIVVRMYLLSLIRLVQRNRYVFECATGTICQSLEWQELHDYLTKFGQDRLLAGDYKLFDKGMGALLILNAFDVLIALAKAAGYSESEILVIYGIAEDTAFAWVNFDGDLVEFFGSNPSGHPLTVIVNSFVNSLYLRYCYRILNPKQEVTTFRDDVAAITYGDDMVAGSRVDWFNHTTVQSTLHSIGIEYTMADKESESVPFIHMNEVTFLKRHFVFDKEIGAIVGPLEWDSIEKMLTVIVKSRSVTIEHQTVDTISSALREIFFHGREKFVLWRKRLHDIVVKKDLLPYANDSTFPTWENLRDEFWAASSSSQPQTSDQLCSDEEDTCERCGDSRCLFRLDAEDDEYMICDYCYMCYPIDEACPCGLKTCVVCGISARDGLVVTDVYDLDMCLPCRHDLGW